MASSGVGNVASTDSPTLLAISPTLVLMCTGYVRTSVFVSTKVVLTFILPARY